MKPVNDGVCRVRRGRSAFFRSLALDMALLLVSSFALSGCGFGWLYMRIGDSKRIKATKILAEDMSQKRLERAKALYRSALGYYEDSIMYDEQGNPEVYYKAGETCLLISPPNLRAAAGRFRQGLSTMRKIFDRKGLTSADRMETTTSGIQYVIVKDRVYAQLHAGMGLVNYLRGIADRDESRFDRALTYLEIADKVSPPYRKDRSGFIDKILDWFDLTELVTPVPIKVIKAQVLIYRGKLAMKKGLEKLAEDYFKEAEENLDSARIRHPRDTRLLAEYTRLYYQRKEYDKCTKYLDEILKTKVYADKVSYLLLKGDILNKLGKYDEAVSIFDDLLEMDNRNVQARVGRAYAYAHKGELTQAMADIEKFIKDDTQDPKLFLEAGRIYKILKDFSSAEQMFLKAFYKDPKDIEYNYELGKLYQDWDKKEKAREAFRRVVRLGQESTYAKEVLPFLAGH